LNRARNVVRSRGSLRTHAHTHGDHRSRRLFTPRVPRFSTCVYSVVLTSACPRSSWTVRMSEPLSSTCVGNGSPTCMAAHPPGQARGPAGSRHCALNDRFVQVDASGRPTPLVAKDAPGWKHTRPCPHPGVLPRRIDVRFDEVTRRSQVEGRVRGCGRATLGTVLHAPELWEIAAPMLPRSSGAVGDGTRDVAHVLRRVAGHRSAVAKSYLVRFFTPSRCGRGHSACCPGRLACCRAPVGRCHVVLGTFLHAVGVWEGALDVLPGSSGVLPGSPWLLPDRSRTFPVSSRL